MLLLAALVSIVIGISVFNISDLPRAPFDLFAQRHARSRLVPPKAAYSSRASAAAADYFDVPVQTALGRFPSASSVRGFHLRAEGLDATMQALLAFCHEKSPDGRKQQVMLTRHVAVWDTNAVNTTQLYLDTCFPIEIAINLDNSVGHCSDFSQYVFHAGARLSRVFPINVIEEKMRRCPHSTYIHGQFPIAEQFEGTERAAAVPRNFWLPNLEWIHHKEAKLFNYTHTILTKNSITKAVLQEYIQRNNVPGPPRVWFMHHSSPDPVELVAGMNYAKDYNTFIHAYGKSIWKHRPQVMRCWLLHPDWPTLDLVGTTPLEELLLEFTPELASLAGVEDPKNFNATAFPPNIVVHDTLTATEFNLLSAERGVHLAASSQEGYGHYINVARALGAVVITTDYPPMSEFVRDGESGILARPTSLSEQLHPEPFKLVEDIFTTQLRLSPENVCTAVQRVLDMPIADRMRMGLNARAAYEDDTAQMVVQMASLLVEAVHALEGRDRPANAEAADGPGKIEAAAAWGVVIDLEDRLAHAATEMAK
ncbi:hypothetical protein HK405_013986 [Cladochytrium tenue]|nr:hypothetical protein HK405_013986 [Cladochytrium tenue]